MEKELKKVDTGRRPSQREEQMRTLNRDEIFELLIIKHADQVSFVEAMEIVVGREPTVDEWQDANQKVTNMRNEWVRMNGNIRNIPHTERNKR